tara:strand:+ start:641 stop:1201 length:561 start_codon:yes stop_codon:yes gene_type:complete
MKKSELQFLKLYREQYTRLTKVDNILEIKLLKLFDHFLKVKKNKNKILIFGNGGSAAIASHFSVDMTKIGDIRTVNFNESDLLTCFSNDYGYENWVKKCIEFYADKGDLVILISSSGESQNMINAAKLTKKKKLKLATFTGFKSNNRLSKYGDINFWVNSKIYNHIENIHLYWLLMLTDFASKKFK